MTNKGILEVKSMGASQFTLYFSNENIAQRTIKTISVHSLKKSQAF